MQQSDVYGNESSQIDSLPQKLPSQLTSDSPQNLKYWRAYNRDVILLQYSIVAYWSLNN